MLVGGEAGVGKTALLRALLRPKQDVDGAGPVGRLRAAADAPPAGAAARRRARRRAASWPSSSRRAARPHEVAAALLRELRRRGPTVLVLEDVHWADEATLDVLTLLAARIGSAARARAGELPRRRARPRPAAPHRARRARAAARPAQGRAALASRRSPSSPRSHGVDARGAVSPHRRQSVLRHRGLAGGRRADPRDGARRGPRARGALVGAGAAAARGGRGRPRARSSCGCWRRWPASSPITSRSAWPRACSARGPAHVAFRHELARLAIEEAIPPTAGSRCTAPRSPRWPRRDGDADVARLAHHAEAAGDAEGVLRWAPRGRRARCRVRRAPRGRRRSTRARFDSPTGCRRDGAPSCCERRAEECYMTAQFDAAIDAQREALDCHRRARRPARRGRRAAVALAAAVLRRPDRGGRAGAARGGRAARAGAAGHELAMAYGNVSQRRMVVEDADAAADGARARSRWPSGSTTPRRSSTRSRTSAPPSSTPAPDDGRLTLERALELARDNGLEEYAGRAFLELALWPLRQRSFDARPAATWTPGSSTARERGLDTWALYLLALRAGSSSPAAAGMRRPTRRRSSSAIRAAPPVARDAGR